MKSTFRTTALISYSEHKRTNLMDRYKQVDGWRHPSRQFDIRWERAEYSDGRLRWKGRTIDPNNDGPR
jgi:hypothetical protein